MKIKGYLASIGLMFAMSVSVGAAAQGLRAEVTADDYSHLQLTFITSDVRVGETTVCGRAFGTLELEGCIPAAAVGRPSLPAASWLIEVPLCRSIDVAVSDAVYDTLDAGQLGMAGLLAPVQPDRRKSDTSPRRLAMDDATYARDAYYSLPLAAVEAVGTARDRRLARLTLSPLSYNPVSGKVVVCRSARVDIRYRDADVPGTKALFDRHHTPAFGIGAECLNSLYPKTVSSAAPIRYTIVANSMFRGALDEFVEWKRRKGFLVDAVYTDEQQVGNTTTSIAAWLKAQYDNANDTMPAPTYVLLVGDVAQIPAFVGETDEEHVSDLYYATWSSGDHVPDCYYGRFSASSLSQLQPQIDKTLMYEQYTFSDPTFLDRAVLVAGVDGGTDGDFGYTHADPTMDYAATNYINQSRNFTDVSYFKNNTSIVPNAPGVTIGSSAGHNAATVRAAYNRGAGFINYSAHGSPDCWGTPYFSVDHVAQMTNNERFGLMIGNCCLSNKFDNTACLGEALLRRDDYCGAVGYIGGSNSTYWGSDFYWSVGVRSSISATMSMNYNAAHLGVYDRVCHTHNELHSKWAETQGSIIMAGNMAVQAGNGGTTAHYYWEIYHLMGDPSVMPWFTQAYDMPLASEQVVAQGTGMLHVEAVPYAYIALTDTTGVVSAAFADASGSATLTIAGGLAVGNYELAVSAQQYKTTFRNIRCVGTDGVCLAVNGLEPEARLEAAATRQTALTLVNIGDSNAAGVTLHFSSDNPHLAFARDTMPVGTVAAHSQVALNGQAMTISSAAADGERATVSVRVVADGTEQYTTQFQYSIRAADIKTSYEIASAVIPHGGVGLLKVHLTNHGFATLTASDLQIVPQTALMAVTPMTQGTITLPYGQTVTRTFQLHADSRLADGASVELHPRLVNPSQPTELDETQTIIIGQREVETFSGSATHTSVWSQGVHPWEYVADTAMAGNICMRSASGLSHNQESEMQLDCTVTQPDSICFRYRVSSESGYDKFFFYIDNEEQMAASGEEGWLRVSYPVAAGQHTFKFSYRKDYSVSDHEDCAMIDDVSLPFTARDITYRTDHLCIGEPYAPMGYSIATQAPTSGVVISPDSLTVVDYYIHGGTTTYDTVVACDGYRVGTTVYTSSTDVVLQLWDQYGCDSSLALHLTVGHSILDTLVVNGPSEYDWNGETITVDGTYIRYLVGAEGCDSVIVLMLNERTERIEEADGVRLTIYPNPTASMVKIGAEVDKVEVYDMSGRLMSAEEKTDRIDLSALPQGAYVLRVTKNGMTAACRVVRR